MEERPILKNEYLVYEGSDLLHENFDLYFAEFTLWREVHFFPFILYIGEAHWMAQTIIYYSSF